MVNESMLQLMIVPAQRCRTLHTEPSRTGGWVGKVWLCVSLRGDPALPVAKEGRSRLRRGPLLSKWEASSLGMLLTTHRKRHICIFPARQGFTRSFLSCPKTPDDSTAVYLDLNSITALSFHKPLNQEQSHTGTTEPGFHSYRAKKMVRAMIYTLNL